MKETVQSILGLIGFRMMRNDTYLALTNQAKISENTANKSLQESVTLETQLADAHQKLAFFRTDADYEIGFKEKAMIDNLLDFGQADFAKMAPWLFSSSLSNHRVVHQRIDEASQLWNAVQETAGPILEVGRAAGGSTAVILGASGDREVDSVDRFPQHADIIDYIFGRADVSNRLSLYSQSSRDPIPLRDYGMLFIDGDHSYDGLCHDIAVFWNRLRSFGNKPAYAVFHDAARNPISYVEPVRLAVSELVEDPGVSKVVGSWGSMLVLEKLSDIDETKWFSKLDDEFWRDLLSADAGFVGPLMCLDGLDNSMSDIELLGESVIQANNFDDQEWKREGIVVTTTDKFGLDNPLRVLRQTDENGSHSISTSIAVEDKTYYVSSHIRPLGVTNIRLGLFFEAEALLAVDFQLSNNPAIISSQGSQKAKVRHNSLGYRNGYFHCEIVVEFDGVLDDIDFKVVMLDEVGGNQFIGEATRAIAINSACIHAAAIENLSKKSGGVKANALAQRSKKEMDRIVSSGSLAHTVDFHGSPFIVLDNLVSDDFISDINKNWPDKSVFQPEIKGSEYFGLYQNDIAGLPIEKRDFWTRFRDQLGPAVIAKVAESFDPYISKLFPGDCYSGGITTHGAMLLMEQDERYEGQGMHTHYYHNPNWVFTMLFYVGDDSGVNPGTSLEYMNFGEDPEGTKTNYGWANMKPTLAEATKFLDPGVRKGGPVYESRVIEYRKNRVFAFLDGPLAFHKVEHSVNDGLCSKRRIIRAHIKVDFEQFLENVSDGVPSADFATLMYPVTKKVGVENKKLYSQILNDVYEKRIKEYGEAILHGKGTNNPANNFENYFSQIKSYRP